ncbi:EAL domain-containing protein [Paracidovorax citrulli]|uniref:Diguanylate cyclase/phosphodiesterase with PAS/PAC sensor(S) n=2 Tax=Paracidovorax citrulli TaxID=80869 RepID=A1TI51_PARC0|nr:EAL domain-containing protein [Paracidovorax citrulli]ABM30639.1 diguanylate cyclase/phosphodiesterase with PAS/PAC sensor(s) [Paracidovorax citrulli AAC00-1]PVY64806.1 diguanylate cyclase/phosphodiesterase with PAS/PAC sensor(s) [Paracidovorax citrulli]QCX10707.1 Phytochrome-like protein cph2 [Paracidovorax citrulli]REG70997.1 diguanylate cyclase/phosphodiesterase with PAS/PAC sensor(s) [Paracidovorax citrulli]RLJ95550.1 diguanylate cyclase/phosphodiesterase with PAS/PAC sensor(s) [Paracid
MPARTDPDYRRLVALHACAILETPAEDTFDQLARLAAHLCGAAVAAIGFMDAGREWFKASAGMELGTLQNLAGDHSLCRLALGGRLVQVEDAQVDPVLRSHPLVQGPSRMRMAACMPIKTTDGLTLGAVVVLDTARRALEESHREALVAIASQAMALLELRRQRRDVARRAQERALSEERFHLVARATADAIWDWNLTDDSMWWNEGMEVLFGVPLHTLPHDSTSWTQRLHPEDSDRVLESIHAAIEGDALHWMDEYRFRRQDGTYAWIRDRGFVIRDAQGQGQRMVGGMTDISAQKQSALQAQRDAGAHAELVRVQQRMSALDLPMEEVLLLAARTAMDLGDGQGAMVVLREGDRLRVRASTGPRAAPLDDTRPMLGYPLWQQLEAEQTVLHSDGSQQHALFATDEGQHGLLSFIAAPLRAGDTVLGMLKVNADPVFTFSQRQVAYVQILAESLGAVLQLRSYAAQLSASELQYRSLFDAHPQPMWVYERGSLRILAVNRAMVRHYGYEEAELLRMTTAQLWPEQERSRQEIEARALPPGVRRDAVHRRHCKKDGTPIDMEVYAGDTTFNGRAARQVLATDVTQRMRMERELARVGTVQRLLGACNEALVRATGETALLSEVCRIAREVGGYRSAWVGMVRHWNGTGRQSIEPVAWAGLTAVGVETLRPSGTPDAPWTPHSPGPSGEALRSGRPVIVRDLRQAPDADLWARPLRQLGLPAVISLPLRDAEQVFGLLTLYPEEVLETGAEETELLQQLANDIAFGLGSLRTRQDQQRLQAVVLKAAAAVSASTGAQFFRQLASHMCDALGAQAGCVTRLLPQPGGQIPRAVTLSRVEEGVVQPNAEYALEGTPSMRLVNEAECVIPEGIAELYPGSPVARLGAQAYVGLQLRSAEGQPIGFVFVVFREPLQQPGMVISTLRIFAARAAAEMARQASDAHIRRQASLLDKARDAIIVRDLDHRITFWNEGAERLYGWTREEATGQSIAELLYQDTQEFLRATRATQEQGEWAGEIVQFHRDGRRLDVEGRWTLIQGEQGQPDAILAIDTDIGQRKATEREIQRLAFYDSLTGLPNRMLLMDRMRHALATAQRRRQGGALLFIDLDNFKTLNDTLGHDQGDVLLQQVAARLNTCVRSVDTVARLGGDEFVVMIEGLSTHPGELAMSARTVGEKILAVLATPYVLQGYHYRSTPSIGVAPFGDGRTSTVGELLKQADLAMYQAKTAGRNTLRFFDPGMQAVVTARAELENDLRTALAREQFMLHYQPQIDRRGSVTGVEALVRWPHPQRGMVSPGEFIPLAEETGLVLPLGRWVLHTACAQLARWQHVPGRGHLSMAVNVSSRQFHHEAFVEDVVRAITATGAPASRLKLELTESLFVEDMETTIATMAALRSHGVGFSLDDFGTGYSSLSYLKRMPLDQLKIDQSFVRDLLADPNDAAIVDTIIALSRSLGLDVIAEGVETAEQRTRLEQAGCRAYQGYFFSRPLPETALEDFLVQKLPSR